LQGRYALTERLLVALFQPKISRASGGQQSDQQSEQAGPCQDA
jgi:hypothetical protein